MNACHFLMLIQCEYLSATRPLSRLVTREVTAVFVLMGMWFWLPPSEKKYVRCFRFGGARCEQEISRCARSPCGSGQMCVSANTSKGYECVCPPGTTGDGCQEADCETEASCQLGSFLF